MSILNNVITITDDDEQSPPNQAVEELRRHLRRRWELASVLHFLSAFEPVLGKEVKMSAEEIEVALITPNDSLAKLHTILLKGIPIVYEKKFSSPDAWVTVLCKKLAEWWPWVAEGELPLAARKGEEISKYKELDPIVRLLMLKALCEVRAEQDDLVSYINDALKEGLELSHFRKERICENGKGTSYWYDGDPVIGHRLYKEVIKFKPKSRHGGKEYFDPVSTNLEWETLATNLDEFRKVSEELSSSTSGDEGALYETIQTQIIPLLEKLQKKKERILKEKQRNEKILNFGRAAGITRSTRNRRPVNYRCDDYDQKMTQAIELMSQGTDQKVESDDRTHSEHGKRDIDASDGYSKKGACSEVGSPAAMDEDVEQSRQGEGNDKEEDISSTDNSDTNDNVEDIHASELENVRDDWRSHENKMQIESSLENPFSHYPRKTQNLRAKNRLRQRPTLNSAIKSVISDTDDGKSSESLSFDVSSEEEPLEVADSEDEISD